MSRPATAANSGGFVRHGPITVWQPAFDPRWPWLAMLVTTRLGGRSAPPYDTLNLGSSTGDDPAHVGANRALLAECLGLADKPWHRLRQVHGTSVLLAGSASEPEADGQWTETPGEVLVVGVADCVPVFLWDAARRRLALVHAGWRGTAAEIVARAVEGLVAAGSRPSDLHLAMGPSIGPCCYAVGPEVAGRLPGSLVTVDGQAHLDLRQANRQIALTSGVRASHIAPDPPCTGCDGIHFYSHRKQGARTGRQWALAWLGPS